MIQSTSATGRRESPPLAQIRDGAGSEMARLRAVHALRLLDTPPEERFDRITRLACDVFDVPMAAVTLIDDRRQFIKSSHGLDPADIDRETAFCNTTIGSDATLVVPDTRLDERFADSRLVTGDPKIRFYAGHPLVVASQHRVGALCLLDTRARDLSGDELALLEEMSSWVERELAVADETDQARLAATMLEPATTPSLAGYAFAALRSSGTNLRGDFWDWRAGGSGIELTIGDTMTAGPAGALTAAVVRTTVRTCAHGCPFPDVIASAAELLEGDLERIEGYAAVLHGQLYADGTVQLHDAGLGLVVLVRADGAAEHLPTRNLPFGVGVMTARRMHRVSLAPGDTLVAFTDGLLRWFGGSLHSAVEAIQQAAAGAVGAIDEAAALVEQLSVRAPEDGAAATALVLHRAR